LPEAERMLRRALRIDASPHYLLSRTLIQFGRSEESKKMLQRWEVLKKGSSR
jgi:hypothetical protein